MNAREILEALNGPADVYQREAVQAAMDHPDEVVPFLLEHLEEVAREPDRFAAEDYDSQLPAYAVVLLSHHKVREAHRLFVDLLSLPDETPFDIFGDLVHEHFPAALWKTCDGNVTEIKKLIENAEANGFCRTSAIRALTFGVATGGLVREEVVEYLKGLFRLEEPSWSDGMVWNAAASALSRLWPGESMEVIRQALDEELIDPGYIGPASLKRALEEGKEARLDALRQRSQKELAEDPHQAMEWWACFNPERFDGMGGLLGAPGHGGRRTGLQKNAAKRKRQQARAARKKGRRKSR